MASLPRAVSGPRDWAEARPCQDGSCGALVGVGVGSRVLVPKWRRGNLWKTYGTSSFYVGNREVRSKIILMSPMSLILLH